MLDWWKWGHGSNLDTIPMSWLGICQKMNPDPVSESTDAHHQIGTAKEFSDASKEYLRRPKEYFARAYAQWVAEKTGDAQALSELDNTAKNPVDKYGLWAPNDFEHVSSAITKIFKEKGWLKWEFKFKTLRKKRTPR